jgi:hypothetical protein
MSGKKVLRDNQKWAGGFYGSEASRRASIFMLLITILQLIWFAIGFRC